MPSGKLMALALALLSGILMAVQGTLNAALSKFIGLIETTLIVHVIGTIILLLAVFLLKLGQGNFLNYQQAPWYSYLGGLISVFIIYLVAASIPKVGAANATTAIIVGQVLTALVIDHFGMFGLEHMECQYRQLLGLGLLAAGAKLLLR